MSAGTKQYKYVTSAGLVRLRVRACAVGGVTKARTAPIAVRSAVPVGSWAVLAGPVVPAQVPTGTTAPAVQNHQW
jgi:hypothetical protein